MLRERALAQKMYLDIISLVVVAAFTEEPVVHDTVDVELIKQRVAVLWLLGLVTL
jgi:hypothetical protein